MFLPNFTFNHIQTIYFKIWIGTIFGYFFWGSKLKIQIIQMIQMIHMIQIIQMLQMIQMIQMTQMIQIIQIMELWNDGWKWLEMYGNG